MKGQVFIVAAASSTETPTGLPVCLLKGKLSIGSGNRDCMGGSPRDRACLGPFLINSAIQGVCCCYPYLQIGKPRHRLVRLPAKVMKAGRREHKKVRVTQTF